MQRFSFYLLRAVLLLGPIRLLAGSSDSSLFVSPVGVLVVDNFIAIEADLGATFNASGTLHFEVHAAGEDCDGTLIHDSLIKVSGGAPYYSGNFLIEHAGTYYYTVSYSGDEKNNPVTASCESFSVEKAEASIFFDNTQAVYDGTPQQAMITTGPNNFNFIATYDGSTDFPVNAGTYQLQVTIDNPDYQGSATTDFVILKASQSIQFDQLPEVFEDDPPFQIFASATSNLPVAFSIVSGPATIDGNNFVTITGVGMILIRAEQSGDSNYEAAKPVEVTFNAAPHAPEIAVEDSNGDPLSDGNSSVDFGALNPDGTSERTIVVRNNGTADLTKLSVNVAGINGDGFSLTQDLPTQSLAPGESTSFTITFAPTVAGSHLGIAHISSNDSDENTFDFSLSGIRLTFLQAWRRHYFNSYANSGNAADSADPDHDGISNVIEFASGSDPTTSSAAPGILSLNDETAEFVYSILKDALSDGFVFQVEHANNIADGSWNTADVTDDIIGDNGVMEFHRASIPVTSSSLFVRLKIFPP